MIAPLRNTTILSAAHHMSYSLKQAAGATGKTKTTILRAIQTGKLSATKDAMGAWQLDPAELHRVYPPIGIAAMRTQQDAAELYERLLADKDLQIARLTEELAAANEERRTTLRQLTALLSDQRNGAGSGQDAIETPPLATTELKPRKWRLFSRA